MLQLDTTDMAPRPDEGWCSPSVAVVEICGMDMRLACVSLEDCYPDLNSAKVSTVV